MTDALKVITLAGDDGVLVTVNLPKSVTNGPHANVVHKLISSGGPSGLSRDEWEKVKDIRVHAKGDLGDAALIVRFDCKWVRIDEPKLTWEEAQALGSDDARNAL